MTDLALEAEEHRLAPLLAPGSIALIGASPKPDSAGNTIVRMPLASGYRGRLYPVNQAYETVEDLACYASLGDLPERVDHAVICLANGRVEAALAEAIRHGARAATIFANCILPEDGSPKLAERLAAMAREAGLQVCGANAMGFYNLEAGLMVCAFPAPVDMTPGGIALISQSGSVFGALAHNDRRPRYNICVSSGAEYTTTTADYLDWALSRDSTRVVGLFLETVRDPEGFEAGLARAVERDLPVVVLKVGRTAESVAMAETHTGAIAGNDAAYEALFRSYGVLRVASLDEMAATLLLFQQGRRAGPGGLATLHDSGGEQQLVTDLARDHGVPFGAISEATKAAIAGHLEPGLKPTNPLDAWGSGVDYAAHFTACFAALMDDPAVAAGLMVVDLRDGYYLHEGYAAAARAMVGRTAKPVALATNLAMVRHSQSALRLTEAGLPVLDGTEPALRAVKHLFAYRDFRAGDRRPPPPTDPALAAKWRPRLCDGTALDEAEALSLLTDYGIPTVEARRAGSLPEAQAAAAALGYPVALKTAAPGIHHKSDVGGVRLGLATPEVLAAAYLEIAARLGPEVLLSAMAPTGVELALGALFDPQFGSCVMVAAGGTLIELLHDRAFALAPVNRHQARDLLDSLTVKDLLAGVRGAAPADLEALAGLVERFSIMVSELGDLLAELDANPVIAGAAGAVAVDALVIARTP